VIPSFKTFFLNSFTLAATNMKVLKIFIDGGEGIDVILSVDWGRESGVSEVGGLIIRGEERGKVTLLRYV
jgi:hypothetical protein